MFHLYFSCSLFRILNFFYTFSTCLGDLKNARERYSAFTNGGTSRDCKDPHCNQGSGCHQHNLLASNIDESKDILATCLGIKGLKFKVDQKLYNAIQQYMKAIERIFDHNKELFNLYKLQFPQDVQVGQWIEIMVVGNWPTVSATDNGLTNRTMSDPSNATCIVFHCVFNGRLAFHLNRFPCSHKKGKD